MSDVVKMPDTTVAGPNADGAFGFALAIVGDLDGDGFDDVVVGAPGLKYGSGSAGAAYKFKGAVTGLSNATRQALPDPGGKGGFGYLVAAGGDIQGNGRGSALVASYIGDYVRLYTVDGAGALASTLLAAKPPGQWNYPAGLE